MAEKIGIDILFNANMKGFDEAIKSVKSDMEKLTGTAKATSAVFAGIATGGLVALNSMSKEFMANEKASSLLTQTFKQNAGAVGLMKEEITDWAKEFSRATGVAQADLETASAQMLTFKNVTGDTFTTALTLAQDLSIAYGQDLKSSTIQLGKALNDPIAGVSALSRVGVQFTDAQKEMIKGFMEVNDIASAQAIILKELESQVGGTSRAFGETMEGGLLIAKNEFAELKAEIFAGLVPVINTLLKDYIIPLLQWFRELSPEVKGFIGITLGLVTALSAMLAPLLAIIGFLPQIINGFKALMGIKALIPILSGITSGIVILTAKILALVAVFKTAYELGKMLSNIPIVSGLIDKGVNLFAGTGLEQSSLTPEAQAKLTSMKQAQTQNLIINNPIFDREQKLNEFQRNLNNNQAPAPVL